MQHDDPILTTIIQQTADIFQKAYKDKYKSSPKESETVICSISIINKCTRDVKIIVVGFGTKSLPYSLAVLHKGKIVKDMHAEMLARRGFIKYLINNLPNKGDENQLFMWDSDKQKHQLQPSNLIALYCNQIFCGDCMTSQSDGLYSGARPLKYFLIKSPPEEQFNEHFLRTKPGRMDLPLEKRSLSLSCSDKVGLWNLLGIQGKRLFNYIKPIYIDTIIIKTYHKISPKQISKGINLPYRISKLCKVAKNKIIGKLFKIVINGKIRVITNQFKHHTPNIIIINKSNQQQIDKKLDNCGIIQNNEISWLCGKTGLPEGVSLHKMNKVSQFCRSQLFKEMQMNEREQFKYHAIKQRIKILFGEWTDSFKTQV